MHVKMITTAAGPDFSANPGDHKEVDAAFGEALVAGGHAVEVDPGETPAARRETATAAKRAKR